MGRAIFTGEGASYCKVYRDTTVFSAKRAEPIEMPFGLWTPMGPRNHMLNGGPDLLQQWVILRGRGRGGRCKV